jgi:hypothetical protein
LKPNFVHAPANPSSCAQNRNSAIENVMKPMRAQSAPAA